MKHEPAVQPLIACLADDNVSFRQSVVAALRDLKAKQAVAPLIALAKTDAKDEVRMPAIQLLGELGSPDASETLMGLLSDPNPEVRASTVGALGSLGVTEAKQPLCEILRKATGKERLAALGALCHLGDTNAVPIIIDALDSDDHLLAPYLIQGLLELGATGAVVRLREHDNEAVRVAASNALKRIERKGSQPSMGAKVP
jgi:HEAT repeat protein